MPSRGGAPGLQRQRAACERPEEAGRQRVEDLGAHVAGRLGSAPKRKRDVQLHLRARRARAPPPSSWSYCGVNAAGSARTTRTAVVQRYAPVLIRSWNLFHGTRARPAGSPTSRRWCGWRVPTAPTSLVLQEIPVWALGRLARGARCPPSPTSPGARHRPASDLRRRLGRTLTSLRPGLFRLGFHGTGERDSPRGRAAGGRPRGGRPEPGRVPPGGGAHPRAGPVVRLAWGKRTADLSGRPAPRRASSSRTCTARVAGGSADPRRRAPAGGRLRREARTGRRPDRDRGGLQCRGFGRCARRLLGAGSADRPHRGARPFAVAAAHMARRETRPRGHAASDHAPVELDL